MTAGFQSQPPFRKRLGRHRTRFSLFSADRVSAFQQLADPQRTQNSRNQGPVAKVGLIIDGGVDSPAIHQRRLARLGPDAQPPEPGSLIALDTIAEAYWTLHMQPPDGWTHELDLRPSVERW